MANENKALDKCLCLMSYIEIEYYNWSIQLGSNLV